MKLHAAMNSSKGLAYVDSDSIHAQYMGPPYSGYIHDFLRPTFGNALGEWKIELEDYSGRFYAPKIYHLSTGKIEYSGLLEDDEEFIEEDETVKHYYAAKGFPVNAEAFAKLIASEKVEVERMRLLKSQARSGGRDVQRVKDSKQWHGLSTKRRAFEHGETEPWHVSELLANKHQSMLSPLFQR
jgi:hypothetical protein